MILRFAGLVRLDGAIMFTFGLKAVEVSGKWQGKPPIRAGLAPEEYCELLGAAGFEAVEFIDADPIAFIWLATWKK